MIISHLSPEYIEYCEQHKIRHDNGAFYYSKELCENIIPKIKTDRNWVTINVKGECLDNSIVFIHNNQNPENYEYLKDYKNLILVCSQITTLEAMIKMFPKNHCIYLPLSIDTEYVKQFKAKRKTKKVCYFGRIVKCPQEILKDDTIDKLYSDNREELLKEVGKYKTVYAIGRCAVEAKCLGCNVIPHEGEYKNTTFDVVDNAEAVKELQRLINEIDKVK